MTAPAFEYNDALANGEIRLLKLIPSSPPDGQIHFTLQHHALQSKSPYWALSYAWGDISNKRVAYCDGEPFPVTESLYSALEQLMALDLLAPIWIDAICINQMDLDEKTHQVRMMHEIYRRSSRTIIWLGKSQSSDAKALKLMRTLTAISPTASRERPKEVSPASGKSPSTSSSSLPRHSFHRDQLPPHDDEAWSALRDFFARPWFSRIWIIQELCASESCVMLCGNVSISHEIILETALRWMKENYMPIVPLVPDGVVTASALARLKRQSQNNQRIDFLSLLKLSYRFHSSVPHDRIFALLGLTSGIDRDMIDYRISYRELLERVVLLLHGQLLGQRSSPFLIFRYCSPLHLRTDGFPSWLPEWRVSLAFGLYNKITAELFPMASCANHPIFHREDHQYLNVQGKIFDVVETVVKGMALVTLRDSWLQDDEIRTLAAEVFETDENIFVKGVEELRNRHQDHSAVENARYQDRLFHALCIGFMEVNPPEHIASGSPGRLAARDLWDNFRDFVLHREIVTRHRREQQWRVMRYLSTTYPEFYYFLIKVVFEKRYSWLSIIRSVILAVSIIGYWKNTTQAIVIFILCVQFVVIVVMTRKYIRIRWPGKLNTEIEYAEAVMTVTRPEYDLFTKTYTPWWEENDFFMTQTGRFGWAVRGVKQGDQLCVFEGHRAPFVLRRLEASAPEHHDESTPPTAYEQCGEAYLPELMNYEVHNALQLQWQKIRLG